MLTADKASVLLGNLHTDWQLAEAGKLLVRRYEFKGFAKAVELSNASVSLAERENHHPDIAFGWGYFQVSITTHSIGGLTENDFAWAAKFDQLAL